MRPFSFAILLCLAACRPGPEPGAGDEGRDVRFQVWVDDPDRACPSSRAASRLTGLSPDRHGLVFAGDLGAHRLSPTVPTRLEDRVRAGDRVVVAVSSPRLAHELSGLWRDVEAADRLEPPWRSSRRPRSPLETLGAAREHLERTGDDDRDVLLILQVVVPELRQENLAPELVDLLLADERLDPEARGLLSRQGLATFFDTYARRRSDPATAALVERHGESWLAAFRRAIHAADLGTEVPAFQAGSEPGSVGFRLRIPPLGEARSLVLEAEDPIFLEPEGRSGRITLRLPASASGQAEFVRTDRRGTPVRLALVPLPGSPHGGRATDPGPSAEELGFELVPTGPPLEPAPTDGQVLAFLRSLRDPAR